MLKTRQTNYAYRPRQVLIGINVTGPTGQRFSSCEEADAVERLVKASPDLLRACERAILDIDNFHELVPGTVEKLRAALKEAREGTLDV